MCFGDARFLHRQNQFTGVARPGKQGNGMLT